jgi:hypothetical protein
MLFLIVHAVEKLREKGAHLPIKRPFFSIFGGFILRPVRRSMRERICLLAAECFLLMQTDSLSP